MAQTSGGALKVYLEGKGLGVPIFVRHPGEEQPLPYVVIYEGIDAPTEGTEDGGSALGGMTPVAEELQVDLLMYEEDPSAGIGAGSVTENYLLPTSIARALAGAALGSLTNPTRRIYGCHLTDGPRELGDPNDPNVIRKTYSVILRRDL